MKRTKFPPNCEVRNSNPSRLLSFVAKQRRVFAEYGFWLCVPLRTPEEKDGHRRYMRDWHRRYRTENRERLSAYHREYWKTVLKPGFTSKAEAVGDEEKLTRRVERKAAEEKRAALEARRQEVHAKYGFWLGMTPKTSDEVAGRERYRKDRDAAYKAAHQEQQKAYRVERGKREKARREQKFQEKYRTLLETDRRKAETFRRQHETLCIIQNMTNEERVRYRQQKQYEKLKASAEREAARKAEREARKEERKRLKRERSAAAYREKRKAEKHVRRDLWLAKCAERRAEAAALAEQERVKAAAFASEREANRAAYIAAKAAMRERGTGNGEQAGALDTSLTGFSELREEPPVAPVPAVSPVPSVPVINVADYLPSHPFRGLLLEDTAPTDEELAGEVTSPVWADYATDEGVNQVPAAGGGSTPIDPPIGNGTTTGGSEDDDDDWRRREREEKIRRVKEQYGFTLGKKPVTPEEIEGKKRYTADRARETAIRNREIDFMLHGKDRVRKATAKKRKATIARKKREAAAQAAREAKAAKREALRKEREAARQAVRVAREEAIEAAVAAKVERKALLEQAYTKFGYKVKAYENKKLKMRRSLGLPKMKRDFTPEQRELWNTYLREGRKELENWLVERMRKELEKARKKDRAEERQQFVAETLAVREQRKQEREVRKRLIFEKYGFTPGKAPATPEEMEGFKRWQRDQEAEYRKRHHDKITAYNREYRRRKRAEALAKLQTTWTRKQWAEWEKRELAKAYPPGSPQWMVREVVKRIAAEQNLPDEAVMERVIELGGLDFIIKGAESMGQKGCNRPSAVVAAARALAFYLDPDKAEMFGEQREEETGKREEHKG